MRLFLCAQIAWNPVEMQRAGKRGGGDNDD